MASFLFGSSPTTVAAAPITEYKSRKNTRDGVLVDQQRQHKSAAAGEESGISFDEFVEELPRAISMRKRNGLQAGSEQDPILALFENLKLTPQDWQAYAHVDASRHYTRNLIATDHVSYTLLLLCWNPGQESPIHDHPCDGCWMRVLQGQIQECRYQQDSKQLVCTSDKVFDEHGGTVFIQDSQGLHKVGNPGAHPAVTMHLYSPPFQSCRIWMDETRKPSKSCICHYSEYGRLV